MCGDLFNRTGTLCGECKDGHYPLVYSFDMNCIQCPSGKSNWWKFLLVAFLPLTIFFYVILFCRVNITSSALFGFVWYCQLVCDSSLAKAFLMAMRNRQQIRITARLVALFYGIWNLDFFRSLYLDICLHGVDTLLALVLDLAVGFYPLLLMVLTYCIIKLHSKGYRLFVFIWRPFGRLSSILDANFSSKTTLIDAFATFFLLTNVKLINISISLLVPVKGFTITTTACHNNTLRLLYDPTVPYFGSRHLPYAVLSITVLTVFVLLPMLLLIMYPFRWFQLISIPMVHFTHLYGLILWLLQRWHTTRNSRLSMVYVTVLLNTTLTQYYCSTYTKRSVFLLCSNATNTILHRGNQRSALQNSCGKIFRDKCHIHPATCSGVHQLYHWL